MARTIDPAAHAVRRETFLDAAQRLIQTKGYEQMSLQDVIGDAGTSKGAFYHYFDSKAALLEGVVDRMVEGATGQVAPVLDDPDLPAADKFRAMFAGIASFKTERRDLLVGLMRTWLSDDNAIVREKFRRAVVARMLPVYTDLIRQGVLEGTFTVTSPEHAARVMLALLLGANEHASWLYVANHAGEIPFEVVEGALSAYPEAMERILGAPPGSLRWWDDAAILHDWFD
jgi:AcrR family transcriptional regulator